MRISDWSSDVCSSDLLFLMMPPVEETPERQQRSDDGDDHPNTIAAREIGEFVAAKLLVHLAEENLVGRGLGRQRGTPRSSERRGHYPRAKRNGSDSILGRVGLFRAGKRTRAHLARIGLDRGGNAAGQLVEVLDEARGAFAQPQHG